MEDKILKSFELIVAGKPEMPNMLDIDACSWAVCDTCGEWCNPADGELCWNCGEIWDEEKRADEQEISFVLDAMTAMVERRFEVVWSNPIHMPPFFMMYVDDTGLEKAKVKAEKFMREVCAERDWDFAGFTMKRIEEYLFCDDPRFGER